LAEKAQPCPPPLGLYPMGNDATELKSRDVVQSEAAAV
jgi:hypothetical protein